MDGTSNYSILKVKTFAVAKVTSVGSDYVNLSWKAGDKDIITSAKCENSDWDWYTGIAKNDYVVVTAGTNYGSGNGLIEKATVVSGKVNGTRGNDDVSVGDNWYTMAGNVARPNTNSNVEMVVVNGYVYYTDTTVGSVDDMALLVEAAPSGGVNSKWEARMIFADGTDKVVTIEKKWKDKDTGDAIKAFHEGTATNPNISGDATYAAPMLVSYEVSKDVYTLTIINANNKNGYDEYVTGTTDIKTDGSIKQTADSSDLTVDRLYYESTGTVFVKYDDKAAKTGATGYADNESDASYKVVTGKTATSYDRPLSVVNAVANKSSNSYYAQAAFISMGASSTGSNSDNYAVVLKNVEKKTGTADGTVYLITAWNGKETITVKTDDSAAAGLSKGSIFSYTATGDTLADIETFSATKEGNYYVQSYDAASGDIALYNATETSTDSGIFKLESNSKTADAWTVVDGKDTTVLFVDSDAGQGQTGYTTENIDLAYVLDEDFWSQGKVPTYVKVIKGVLTEVEENGSAKTYSDGKTNTMKQDFAPNVRIYVDDDSDDQITVIVVDVNRNINQW